VRDAQQGPHILEALEVLEDILPRMEAHQHKKRAMLRPLHLADRFFPSHRSEKLA
jgi:pyruvate kinase